MTDAKKMSAHQHNNLKEDSAGQILATSDVQLVLLDNISSQEE